MRWNDISIARLKQMIASRVKTDQIFNDSLSLEERRPYLETLFSGRPALTAGFAGQAGSCFLFWFHQSDRNYWAFIGLAFFILIARHLHMQRYDKVGKELMANGTARQLKKWYLSYILGSSATSLFIGMLAAYSILVHPETWASGVSLALTLGTMVAAVGRNFGSTRNVALIVLCSFIPIVVAFVTYGVRTGNLTVGIGFACLLIPFMLATMSMASEVNRRFAEANKSSADAQASERRLHSALTNMPGGLVQIDKHGVITLANENVWKIFGIEGVSQTHVEQEPSVTGGSALKNEAAVTPKPKVKLVGRKLSDLFELGTMKVSDPKEALRIEGRLHDIAAGLELSEADSTFRINDDLYVQFTIRDHEAQKLRAERARAVDAKDGEFVIVVQDVTVAAKHQQALDHAACTDKLSALPNRVGLYKELELAMAGTRGKNKLAFCVFDVDKFKDINDTLGHAMGDAVIECVGNSMLELRKSNAEKGRNLVVARWGGDEFVIALPNVTKEFDFEAFFDHVFDTIGRTYVITDKAHGTSKKKSIDVRCSGGVILFGRTGGKFDFEEAYKKADMALYQVKRAKKDRTGSTKAWALFDGELEKAFSNEQQLKYELQTAVSNGDMVVHYQPMVTPDGLNIDTCEALCRWQHPEKGFMGPEKFIGYAESMNMIGDITRYMLRTACRDCAAWDDKTSVSVNLSVLDLAHIEIVEVISSALRDANLSPSRLQVEITESIFLKDTGKARDILNMLNGMGVKAAMDDFGTGYANLSTIAELPLSKVKIDRSFIQNIDTEEKPRKLFEAMVMLAKIMGLGIVVEGVENKAQLDLIKNSGVALIQGYHFHRPMPHKDIIEALRKTEIERLKASGLAPTETNVIALPTTPRGGQSQGA